MTVRVSERLRDALERLDQAIDRLDVRAAAAGGGAAPSGHAGKLSDTTAIAARLDQMIERVETALAG